ncbi:hypothetical protein QFZ85_002712 [Pseudomonas frederiksbergensis]
MGSNSSLMFYTHLFCADKRKVGLPQASLQNELAVK